jgi:hypothetical protein
MKNLLSVLLLFTGIISASAQNIPNASFEGWHPYVLGEYPDFWTTSDSVAQANSSGTPSVFSGNDPYDGALSMHLKSVQISIFGFPVTGPGIATNGLVNLVGASFVFSGGSPDTARSRYFNGQYKYAPANPADAAIIKVYLFRNITGTRDTIASGSLELTGTVSTYTTFAVEMHYHDPVNQPDSSLIIIQSSRAINDPNLGVGSELVVDSLGFSGWVGIDELKNAITSVNVFPTPADKEISIEVELKNNISLSYEIYDISGRLLRSALMNTTKEKVDVSEFSSGKYILKIGDAKKNLLYTKNFSINR